MMQADAGRKRAPGYWDTRYHHAYACVQSRPSNSGRGVPGPGCLLVSYYARNSTLRASLRRVKRVLSVFADSFRSHHH